MLPPEYHAEISGILGKEYRAAKELLSKEKARLMRMAAELVVDRRMEFQARGSAEVRMLLDQHYMLDRSICMDIEKSRHFLSL
ncbi:hypothetical protein FHT86_000751 [Rhizobium sp. BK313]|uniref:hypothetical protein n=1 Tax=Rhizobium sp. BK313 TaxID=2587081 RepID=UPI0018334CDC|nr:hypothetical protein [Rhizobium sp. BK313]MBB3452495.1 hypothetical protein [Rhizobium sp. BK313]